MPNKNPSLYKKVNCKAKLNALQLVFAFLLFAGQFGATGGAKNILRV